MDTQAVQILAADANIIAALSFGLPLELVGERYPIRATEDYDVAT
jgi:hypothetical protein